MKYQAFISYKHDEYCKKQAIALEKALKEYARPSLKPPIKIFRDEKITRPGDALGATFREALRNSKFLIYLASKEAAESEWVEKEIKYWCEELKRVDRIIIIHIADEIIVDKKKETINWQESNALPSVLKEYISTLPVFESLTWVQKGEIIDLNNTRFKEIINRIIARFRNTTPEEMNDQAVLIHRKNIKRMYAAIFLLIGLLIIAILTTLYAFKQRNVAIKEKEIAQVNSLISESRRLIPIDNVQAIRLVEKAFHRKFHTVLLLAELDNRLNN